MLYKLIFVKKKSRTPWCDHNDSHTRQSSFPRFRSRNFLSLPYDRFSIKNF